MNEKIESRRVYDFLEGMKVDSKFEFIEDASTNSKLKEILDKVKLKTENRDLGFFHNIYAITDKANKNQCILPKDKVQAGLDSIRQKPVNAEHNRTSVLGHYLEGELVGDEIHSYGCIYKSCFPEKWEEAKTLFKSGKLNSSFEIWCPKEKRTYKDNGDFTLDEIDIAGGAILFKEPPAFDEAKVLELAKEVANNHNNMVYAYDEADMLKCSVNKPNLESTNIGLSKLGVSDMSWVSTFINNITCPVCDRNYVLDCNIIDLENLKVEAKCYYCESLISIDLDISDKAKVIKKGKVKKITIIEKKQDIPSESQVIVLEDASYGCECLSCGYTISSEEHCKDIKCPKCGGEMRREDRPSKLSLSDEDVKMWKSIFQEELEEFNISDFENQKILTYKDQKDLVDDDFAVIQYAINKKLKKKQKIRRFPINDEINVQKAYSRLPQARGVSKEEGVLALNRILEKAKALDMTDLLKKHNNKGGINMDELKLAQEKIVMLEKDNKAKDEVVAQKDEEIKVLKAKVTEIEEAKKVVEAEITRRDEEIKSATIKARKEELGEEYIKANSIKDEDLLDNVKFENAKLKKENEQLKSTTPTSAMIAGHKLRSTDEIKKAHDKIESEAYGYTDSK